MTAHLAYGSLSHWLVVKGKQSLTSPGTKVRGRLSNQGRKRHTLESTQNLDGMAISLLIEILKS
jgi:hypothetical protein